VADVYAREPAGAGGRESGDSQQPAAGDAGPGGDVDTAIDQPGATGDGVDHAVSPRRFFVLLVGVFAGLGLFLASLGIYGVISYSVTQRTQEIGIRMALGATRGRVQLGVIAKTIGMAAIGIAIGAVASVGVSSLIASLLFGTTPTDPPTFAAIVLLLVIVALLAGYIPARRASRINPMVALRNN